MMFKVFTKLEQEISFAIFFQRILPMNFPAEYLKQMAISWTATFDNVNDHALLSSRDITTDIRYLLQYLMYV